MQNLMPPINTPDNLFHDGNPLIGTQGTIVTAEHLNHVQGAVRDLQRELLNILLDAGIDIDPNDDSQVLDALKAIIGRDYSGKFLTKLNNLKEILDAGVNAQASARKNLGLGAAATYGVQGSPADATPGKLVPIGGFGLGAENTPVANINADAMNVSGFYGGPGVNGVNYYDPYAALLVMSRYSGVGAMLQVNELGKAAVRGRGLNGLSGWNELFGKLNPPTPQDCNALPSDGTALAANKLSQGRLIGGVKFDGTADITPSLATTSTRLQTARMIAGVSFDGTRNIDIPAGNVGAYTKEEVNSLIPTSSVSGTSVKTFIWMGIMIQVGRVNGSVSSSAELTLPVAFKSYAQVLGSVDAASGSGVNAGVNMIGLGKIAFTRAGNYGPLTFLAIGDV